MSTFFYSGNNQNVLTFCQILPIFVISCQFLSFLSIFVIFCQFLSFLSIFVNFCQFCHFLSIFCHFCQFCRSVNFVNFVKILSIISKTRVFTSPARDFAIVQLREYLIQASHQLKRPFWGHLESLHPFSKVSNSSVLACEMIKNTPLQMVQIACYLPSRRWTAGRTAGRPDDICSFFDPIYSRV